MEPREQQLRQMIEDFPDSTLPWFSLGRYLLEGARFEEAAEAFERCVAVDPTYAAALLSLGDAWAGLDEVEKAKEAWRRCSEAAMDQDHPTLAAEADERIEELEG